MTAADLPEVLALWSVTEGVGLNELDTPEQLAAYLARNPDLSLVVRSGASAGLPSSVISLGASAGRSRGGTGSASAHSEGQIIAAVLCGHDGRRGYLHHLAVIPEFRRSFGNTTSDGPSPSSTYDIQPTQLTRLNRHRIHPAAYLARPTSKSFKGQHVPD
jgi:hypothetical protein